MTKQYLLLLLIVISFACDPKPNSKELIVGDPELIQNTTNGQKFIIGNLNDSEGNYMYVANLKGTPFEMGKAFGQLFKDQIKDQMGLFFNYYLDQLEELLVEKKLPVFLAKKLTTGVHGLANEILDLNIMITKKYTNPRYYQEIKGIGVGAKMNSQIISRLNIFPELIKAACTVAGVWKSASLNQQTLHMRALDWDSKNLISKYPLITVYHPSDKNLQVHANIGWVGFVGALTGMSQKVALGEKVWLPPKNSVKMTRYGNPWTYVIRDVLYEATDIQSALSILSTTHRTCAIHLGLSSSEDHEFRMLEYSQNILNNYDDTNYTHYNPKSHPNKTGIAYFDKHVQPSGDSCVGSLLTHPDYYGKWTMEQFWRVVGNSHETGDTQLVVFDLERQTVIISYSRNYENENGEKVSEKAFTRSPIFVDMGRLWWDF